MKDKFNTTNCLLMQYNILKGMFFDELHETKEYILCTSKIMDDYYWNLAYLKNKTNDKVIEEIESKMINLKRTPCIYIGSGEPAYSYNRDLIEKRGFKLKDSDVYMLLKNRLNIDINTKIKIVETKTEYNDFMKVLSSAFNDNVENEDENFYQNAVTDCYYKAIKSSIGNGKTYHIIAYDNNIPVSVATLNMYNNIGGINNVGTHQGYWNRGYSKQVLAYLINLFKEKGGEHLILCTEYNTKNQTFYEHLGFDAIYVMEQYVK